MLGAAVGVAVAVSLLRAGDGVGDQVGVAGVEGGQRLQDGRVEGGGWEARGLAAVGAVAAARKAGVVAVDAGAAGGGGAGELVSARRAGDQPGQVVVAAGGPMGVGHGLGWSGCFGTALVLPGASDQDGQGLHCAGVLGGCHRDRLDAGHRDSGLGGAGALGGGPCPSAGRGRPTAVRSGLACRPEPGGWTLILAAAVKLNRGQSRVAIAVGWNACWWSRHGVAPRVPPNIADSREIGIQGPFLAPARFPHRRNRDPKGCFHTRARTRLPELVAAKPVGAHEAAG